MQLLGPDIHQMLSGPDFLGIGAQKAGTTWLFESLRLHPDISFPAGKEVHFWDKAYGRGIDWYKSLFTGAKPETCKSGEITPAYATLASSFIEECHIHFPQLRIIMLIRNPIERAWSSAQMALSRSQMLIEEASDQWFIDHFRSRASMMRGDYEQCLRQWFAIYPKRQVFVALFDELSADPEALLRRCFQHIGVDEEVFDWSYDLRRRVFPTGDVPLPDRLRYYLWELYEPKIASLERFLGQDLSAWK